MPEKMARAGASRRVTKRNEATAYR